MKKIIWISSYPKSGNTWMRYLLAHYFFNNKMVFDKTIIKYIDKLHLPEDIHNKYIGNKLDVSHVAKYWIPSQEKLEVVNGQVTFLKTHNANISIGKNNFTNEKLTVAIIYMVRDPRDIVVSEKNYFGSNYEKLIDNICNKKLHTIYDEDNKSNLDVVSTWDIHFKSWMNKMPNVPKILVKYEDLIENTESVFKNVINSLSKILNFQINHDKIRFSVENSKFDKLSKMEDDEGFEENIGDNPKKFFNLGKIGEYKNEMTNAQINLINDKFSDLMKYLKYL